MGRRPGRVAKPVSCDQSLLFASPRASSATSPRKDHHRTNGLPASRCTESPGRDQDHRGAGPHFTAADRPVLGPAATRTVGTSAYPGLICGVDLHRTSVPSRRAHPALCGVVWRDYGALVTGGNMEPGSGRMDFEFERMSGELVGEIEAKVNDELGLGRDVRVRVLPRAEAFAIPDLIRTKVNLLPP